jgi:hypothetical protein
MTYENRTKTAKSGGSERTAPRERISGSELLTAVRRLGPERPRILGIQVGQKPVGETL